MVFVQLNILPYIQELASRKSAYFHFEINCQYISYDIFLSSDSHHEVCVGAKYLVSLQFLVTNISSCHRLYSAYHNMTVHHFGRKTESWIV